MNEMGETATSPSSTYGRVRSEEANLTIWDIAEVIWDGKWLIASVTTLGLIFSVTYAFTATKWYRAEVVLAPVQDDPNAGVNVGLSGLATLAGLDLGGNARTAEARAVLESEDFARMFIEENNLVPTLFAELWDKNLGRWKPEHSDEHPNSRDAARLFEDKVRRVSLNRETGLVTVTMEWTSPTVAADWANAYVTRLNALMRKRAQAEAEQNLVYLQKQLAATSIIPLQNSISSLVENELQRLMLAQRTEEFSFRIIDRADPPLVPSWPNRTLIVTLGILVSGVISLVIVLLRDAVQKRSNHATRGVPSSDVSA